MHNYFACMIHGRMERWLKIVSDFCALSREETIVSPQLNNNIAKSDTPKCHCFDRPHMAPSPQPKGPHSPLGDLVSRKGCVASIYGLVILVVACFIPY